MNFLLFNGKQYWILLQIKQFRESGQRIFQQDRERSPQTGINARKAETHRWHDLSRDHQTQKEAFQKCLFLCLMVLI